MATIHMSNQATPSRMTRETCPSRKRNRSSIYRKIWICCHHKVHTQTNSDEVQKSLILKYSQQNYTAHRANSRRNALRRAASSKTWIRELRTSSKGVSNWATIPATLGECRVISVNLLLTKRGTIRREDRRVLRHSIFALQYAFREHHLLIENHGS